MNQDLQGIKNGIFWKTVSTGLNALAGFFMSIILARFLGKDGYGELILVYTVVSLFAVLSNFGLNAALQRFIPLYIKRKDDEKTTAFILTSVGLGVFFTTLSSVIMFLMSDFIAVDIFHNPAAAVYMRWGVLYLFTLSFLTNIVFSIYYGFQRWKEECLLNGIYLFLSSSAVFIALSAFKKGIAEILEISAAACLIGIAGGMFYIARFVKSLAAPLKVDEFRSQIKETLYFSTPMLMGGVLFYFVTQFDKLILGKYRPAGELAQYYIALALGTGIIMFIRVSETVLTPYLARLTGEDDMLLKTRFQTIFRLFLHLPIAASIFLYFFIGPFIRFVYGPNFEIAVAAFKIYLIILVLRSAMTPLGLFLTNVYANTREIAKISVLSASAHFILYITLIPRYGYKGALATMIIAYMIVWAYVVLAVKDIKRLIPYRSLLHAAVGMAIVASACFIADFCRVYNKLLFSFLLPLVYLSFVLLREDVKISRIKNAV